MATAHGNGDDNDKDDEDNNKNKEDPVPRDEISDNPRFEELKVGYKVVYAVWVQEDETAGRADVFFVKSEDGGETFSEPINLSSNEEWSDSPRITAVNSHVHVVWVDYEDGEPVAGGSGIVTVRSSDDGGETFDDAVLMSAERPVGEIPMLQIEATTSAGDNNTNNNNNDADDSNVYISWTVDAFEDFGGNLTFAASDNSGQSFEVTDLVNYTTFYEMEIAAAASDDDADKIYVAGSAASERSHEDADQIFFQRSTDGGKTFDDPIFLDDTELDEGRRFPSVGFGSLEVDDDEIRVAWIVWTGESTFERFFSVSTDGGATFSQPQPE